MTTSISPFVAPLEPQLFFKPSSHTSSTHWQLDIEASCWLRSLSKGIARIEFMIEYRDAIRIRRQKIDTLDSSFFQDCLLSGRFQLEGYGGIESAQVTIESSGPLELHNLDVRLADYQQSLHQPLHQGQSSLHKCSLRRFLFHRLVA